MASPTYWPIRHWNCTMRRGDQLGPNINCRPRKTAGTTPSNQVSDIQNSGHVPTDASESAIIATLAPGNYTAVVRGVSIFFLMILRPPRSTLFPSTTLFRSISTRGFVQTGQNVMIGGFIVQG